MPAYTIRQTEEFRDWLDALPDRRAQARIALRLRHAEQGNLGDWEPTGGSVSEMRVDTGPGYRLYFMRRRKTTLIILTGGDKSTQSRDIRRAQQLARQYAVDNVS